MFTKGKDKCVYQYRIVKLIFADISQQSASVNWRNLFPQNVKTRAQLSVALENVELVHKCVDSTCMGTSTWKKENKHNNKAY